MSSKKKVTGKIEVPIPPAKKTYFLISSDGEHSAAIYTEGKVTIAHTDEAYFEIRDSGSGYEITDVSPLGGTKKIDVDYSMATDLFAALKIFYHNADKINGEYWTIFQGEKL